MAGIKTPDSRNERKRNALLKAIGRVSITPVLDDRKFHPYPLAR